MDGVCVLPLGVLAVLAWLAFRTRQTWLDLYYNGWPHSPRVYTPCLKGLTPLETLAGLEVVPGVGFGPVRFGMLPCAVVSYFGPTQSWDVWGDGNLNDWLIFDGVGVQFDQWDASPLHLAKVDTIEVRRADAILFGRRLSEWHESELVPRFVATGLKLQYVEPGYAQFEAYRVCLWFSESGELTSIAIRR